MPGETSLDLRPRLLGPHRVRDLLEAAAAGRLRLLMSMIDVGEVYYLLMKSGQGPAAEDFVQALGSSMPIEPLLPDRDCILHLLRRRLRRRNRHPA